MLPGKKDMIMPDVWGKNKKEARAVGTIFSDVSKKVINWANQMWSHIFNIGVQLAKIGLVIGGTAGLLGVILAGILAKMMDTGKVLDDVSRASGIAGRSEERRVGEEGRSRW